MMRQATATATRPSQHPQAKIEKRADEAGKATWLLCRAGEHRCALPIEHVIEIMRSLPVEPIAGAPHYVPGVSVIRGEAVPVLDIGLLLGNQPMVTGRLVTIRAETRTIALAVQSVSGIFALDAEASGRLPPLLRDAASEAVAGIGTRDGKLMLFLHAARLVPEDVLPLPNAEEAAS
jgi:purine-binding chemotaxis protein CheW